MSLLGDHFGLPRGEARMAHVTQTSLMDMVCETVCQRCLGAIRLGLSRLS